MKQILRTVSEKRKSIPLISRVALLVLFGVLFTSVCLSFVYADDEITTDVPEAEAVPAENAESEQVEKAEQKAEVAEQEEIVEDELMATVKEYLHFHLFTLDIDTVEIISRAEFKDVVTDQIYYFADVKDADDIRGSFVFIRNDEGVLKGHYFCQEPSRMYTTKYDLDSFKELYYWGLFLWGLDENGVYTNLETGETRIYDDFIVPEVKKCKVRITEHWAGGVLVERTIDGVPVDVNADFDINDYRE